LDACAVALTRQRVSDVLDGDTQSHAWCVTFLQHRVADPRVLRLVQQWRRAGVSEEGQWSETTVGVPQGAVVSPLLANVYLHDVIDLWGEAWRQRIVPGDMVGVCWADDCGLGFESRRAAERCSVAWRDRLHQFGLERHAEQTRLIECGPQAIANRQQRGEGQQDTFDLRGFTHIG
jgi:retron-type reverse transcriptase